MSEVTGKAKGGKARAEKLTQEERSEIARKGGEARWKVDAVEQKYPILVESCRSEIVLGDIKIPCAVINTGTEIKRVFTETGITNAILGGRSGASKKIKKDSLGGGAPKPIFLAPERLKPFIDAEFDDGLLNPIDYLDGEKLIRGYDYMILPASCNVWLKARAAGVLQKQQLAKAQKAEILMRALAGVGLAALIDEATGYQKIRPQNALQEYLALLIREELAVWVKTFPDEFFENIYKLKGWTWYGIQKNRYSVVGTYINDIIYERLAPGVLEKLQELNPKDEKGNRKDKHFQWLKENTGYALLIQHIQTILTLQRLAIAQGHGWKRFMASVDMVAPKKGGQLLLPIGL